MSGGRHGNSSEQVEATKRELREQNRNARERRGNRTRELTERAGSTKRKSTREAAIIVHR